jgi:hypothetical protein
METWKEQYERVKRSLCRIENRNEDLSEYHKDDIWHFFQDCYHLKDWLKNDSTIDDKTKGKNGDNIEKFVRSNIELQLCADLANRTKHLELLKERVDKNIETRSIAFHGPTISIKNKNGKEVYNSGPGKSNIEYFIQLSDKKYYEVLDIARKAVGLWEGFLKNNNLL